MPETLCVAPREKANLAPIFYFILILRLSHTPLPRFRVNDSHPFPPSFYSRPTIHDLKIPSMFVCMSWSWYLHSMPYFKNMLVHACDTKVSRFKNRLSQAWCFSYFAVLCVFAFALQETTFMSKPRAESLPHEDRYH